MCIIRDEEEEWQEVETALATVFDRWVHLVSYALDRNEAAQVDWIGDFCADARVRLSDLARQNRLASVDAERRFKATNVSSSPP